MKAADDIKNLDIFFIKSVNISTKLAILYVFVLC